MRVEAGVVLLGKADSPTLSGLIGIKQMLQPDPDVDTAAGLAVPCFDQRLIHIERVEIVIFRMLTDIGHGEQPIADLLGRPSTAFHESPHVDYGRGAGDHRLDRKSTRLNSSHSSISYAVFCLKKKK